MSRVETDLGKMGAVLPSGWSWRLLADLGVWSGGHTPLKSNPLYWNDGSVLWLSPKDISGAEVSDSEDKITKAALEGTGLRVYSPNAVIVVVRSGILRHHFPVTRCTKPFTINQDLKVISPKDDVEPSFVFAVLKQLESVVLRKIVKAGTTVESVDIPTFLKLEVPVPSSSEQRKIAKILTTVDNLIGKTEALIAKYQAIKQGMMHDLFTRGVDEYGHLRPPYDEAPELYKESDLGWIPKEWERFQVQDVLVGRPKNGYSPQESLEWSGTLMLGLGCLTPSGFAPLQLKNAPREDPNVSAALLKDGDLLMSRSNTRELVGLAGRFQAIGVPCSYPDLMMRLTPNSKVLAEFLELLLRHDPVRRQLTGAASGTSGSMVKINSSIVLNT